MASRRVLYVQYTNPGGYPPLVHSARLLADQGFSVRLLGTNPLAQTMSFPHHDRIDVRLMQFQAGGWRQKAHYLRFSLWAIATAILWRPTWVYASDLLSTPIALVLTGFFGRRLIYHEHDSPSAGAGRPPADSRLMRLVMTARRLCAQRAELCVLPNAIRAEALRNVAEGAHVVTVWNCPSRAEIVCEPREVDSNRLSVLFHGSVTPDRGLEPVLDALVLLPPSISLVIVGYDTVGQPGYLAQLAARAERLGLAERIQFKGAMSRDELMRHCATCDVGLALMKSPADDINELGMVGASNKPFDYLACRLPVLVSHLPDWEATYVEAGFGRSCDPRSPSSIAAALQWFLEHPCERVAMGERGRQRIRDSWNYDSQFLPVMQRMSAGTAVNLTATDPRTQQKPTVPC